MEKRIDAKALELRNTNDMELYTLHLFAGAGGGILADLKPLAMDKFHSWLRKHGAI